MPIPDFQSLMLPALKLSSTGLIKFRNAIDILSDEFNLTEEERDTLLPSGKMTTIRNRIAWSVTYLVKAGLINRPTRGYFTITDIGKEVLSKIPNKIDINFLMQFQGMQEFKKNKKKETIDNSETEIASLTTPEEQIDTAHEEITSNIKSEILTKVLESTPEFFERLIVRLLIAMGYGSSESGTHLGKSGDGGVDGVINGDKLGLDIIYVQAKRYAPDSTIGRPDIQKFSGSLIGFGATKGVFVTTSSFSNHAIEFAKNVPQRIILVDGEKLSTLMIEHNVGVRVQQTIELKRIDEDFFMD